MYQGTPETERRGCSYTVGPYAELQLRSMDWQSSSPTGHYEHVLYCSALQLLPGPRWVSKQQRCCAAAQWAARAAVEGGERDTL